MPVEKSITDDRSFFYGDDEILLQTRLIINYAVLFPAFGSTQTVIRTGINDAQISRLANQETLQGSGAYLFSALIVAQKIAGNVPVILINEPRPSPIVSQSDYLQYRQEMLNLDKEQHWNFLDLWNLVSDDGFLDSIHRNTNGEAVFNKTVVAAALKMACGND